MDTNSVDKLQSAKNQVRQLGFAQGYGGAELVPVNKIKSSA